MIALLPRMELGLGLLAEWQELLVYKVAVLISKQNVIMIKQTVLIVTIQKVISIVVVIQK